MKHARDDYNRIQDPAGLIGEDEPVFLIRATDRVAPDAVRSWADFHLAMDGNEDIASAAYRQADLMEEWQKEHGSKEADMPSAESTHDLARNAETTCDRDDS